MSGGGAGKVYFVLYLAVVLELLIIIVERDEAEEHLHAKQKETMKIVQSILSQLQAGSGTEGINTRPQDEITIPPSGINFKDVMGTDIKTSRKYVIEVGVTDVASDLKKKEGETPDEFNERLHKLIRLANVQELEYQIFFNPSKDPLNPPTFPSEKYFDENNIEVMKMNPGDKMETTNGEVWTFKGAKKLVMDIEPTFNKVNKDKLKSDPLDPVYKAPIIVGEKFVPSEVKEDSTFYFSSNRVVDADGKSVVKNGKEDSKLKRAFVVYFEPPAEEGWYKLRFYSKTNRILGIAADAKADELTDNMTVNIGTVQLKVKDLHKVSKELEIELDKFKLPKQSDLLASADGSDNFDEMIEASKKLAEDELDYIQVSTKIELYGYIIRLLTPGKSVYFPQNSNSIEFDIRVLTPKPKLAAPIIAVNGYLHSFDEATPSFRLSISPYQDNGNIIKGSVFNKGDETGSPVAEITFEPVNANPPPNGESRAYIGKVNKQLLAGNGIARQYTVKLKHELMGKQGDTTATLNVYPTINEDEVKKLGIQFEAFGTYGNDFFFNFTPPSGRNVAPDQFGYYFKTDGDAQDRGLVPGLKAERSDKLTFPSNAKEASLKIVWIDPITKKEVAVFPEKTIQIKQTAPGISTNFANESIAGDDVLSCRISNIKLQAPPVGDGKFANVDFTVDVDQVLVKQNYRIVGKPNVTRDGESVTIDFKLQGEPNEDGWAKGTVTLKMVAVATNPGNGVKSEPVRKTYSFRVNKKIETEDDFYDY
jgi:hypothetical protein